MIAGTRPHSGSALPVLLLMTILAFIIALPQLEARSDLTTPAQEEIEKHIVVALPSGATDTVVTEHAKTKHEAGTLPASTIFERISRGQYRLFYRAASDEYIALVETGGLCGGARLRRPDAKGVRYWATAFGGSECWAHPEGSCAYWWCNIEKGGYVPVAGVGG